MSKLKFIIILIKYAEIGIAKEMFIRFEISYTID